MFTTILIGSLTLIINMLIQVFAVVVTIGYIIRLMNSGKLTPGLGKDMWVLSIVLLVLFFGHLLQFATWATLFVYLGEFSDFQVAYYYSTVSFTSLGYGDIVMGEKWRLLGGLEAANGILMFGLTTSTFIAVINRLFSRHKSLIDARKHNSDVGGAAK